jgi:hypothetical protein
MPRGTVHFAGFENLCITCVRLGLAKKDRARMTAWLQTWETNIDSSHSCGMHNQFPCRIEPGRGRLCLPECTYITPHRYHSVDPRLDAVNRAKREIVKVGAAAIRID